jgi:hypothetical protein
MHIAGLRHTSHGTRYRFQSRTTLHRGHVNIICFHSLPKPYPQFSAVVHLAQEAVGGSEPFGGGELATCR